jgi:excisionase family DNA binding protein
MKAQDEELLTVREVARRCHRSEETVRRWIWSGKLPARKLGNQLFVEGCALPLLADRRLISQEPPLERRYDAEQMKKLFERMARLRRRLFKKYGYFDVAAAVRESRDSH